MTEERMTAVFEHDVADVVGNPCHVNTPFGCAVSVSRGDVYQEHYRAIADKDAEIAQLRSTLQWLNEEIDVGYINRRIDEALS